MGEGFPVHLLTHICSLPVFSTTPRADPSEWPQAFSVCHTRPRFLAPRLSCSAEAGARGTVPAWEAGGRAVLGGFLGVLAQPSSVSLGTEHSLRVQEG